MDYSKDDSGYLRFQLSQAKQRMKGRGPQGVQAASEAHDRIKAELARRETAAKSEGSKTGGEKQESKSAETFGVQPTKSQSELDEMADRAGIGPKTASWNKSADRDDPQRDSALSKLAASKEGKAEASGLVALYKQMGGDAPRWKAAGPADPAQIKDPTPDIDEAEQAVVSGLVREAQDAQAESEEGPEEGRGAAHERAVSKLKEAADHSEKHGDAKAAAKLRETAEHVEKKRSGGEGGKAQEAEAKSTETGSRGGTYYTTESGKKVYVKKG